MQLMIDHHACCAPGAYEAWTRESESLRSLANNQEVDRTQHVPFVYRPNRENACGIRENVGSFFRRIGGEHAVYYGWLAAASLLIP